MITLNVSYNQVFPLADPFFTCDFFLSIFLTLNKQRNKNLFVQIQTQIQIQKWNELHWINVIIIWIEANKGPNKEQNREQNRNNNKNTK